MWTPEVLTWTPDRSSLIHMQSTEPISPTVQVNGRALRSARKAAGLDAMELAVKVGIDRSFLYHLERGSRSRMSPAKFNALASALGVDRADLLAEDAA